MQKTYIPGHPHQRYIETNSEAAASPIPHLLAVQRTDVGAYVFCLISMIPENVAKYCRQYIVCFIASYIEYFNHICKAPKYLGVCISDI